MLFLSKGTSPMLKIERETKSIEVMMRNLFCWTLVRTSSKLQSRSICEAKLFRLILGFGKWRASDSLLLLPQSHTMCLFGLHAMPLFLQILGRD